MNKSETSELEWLGLDYKSLVVRTMIEQDIRYYKDLLKERVGMDDMDCSKQDLDHLIKLFEIEDDKEIDKLLQDRKDIIEKVEQDYRELERQNEL